MQSYGRGTAPRFRPDSLRIRSGFRLVCGWTYPLLCDSMRVPWTMSSTLLHLPVPLIRPRTNIGHVLVTPRCGACSGRSGWRAIVGLVAALACTRAPSAAHAQTPLSAADSALVGRMLLAEDARDRTDPALRAGMAHRDARISSMAERAMQRIVDPVFSRRDSLRMTPIPPASPVYAQPEWRIRYFALALSAQRGNCDALNTYMADSAWSVRLRAADLVPASCSSNAELVATLVRFMDALPADASQRARGGVSWHGAAHALVAYARVQPQQAGSRLPAFTRHAQPEVREYAVRAAVVLSDTATLLTLARDANPNVQASGIDALRALTAHAHDSLYIRALDRGAPQVVRSAALALARRGPPRVDPTGKLVPGGDASPQVRALADSMYARWLNYGNASFRDVRHALLRLAGRDTSEDRGVPARVVLPSRTVAMALGETVRVRVTMSPASGGGAFVVRMRGDVAPMMAGHIVDLVEQQYYDGLTWHRVEQHFVVQGGSPGANEYVGLFHFLRDALGTVPHARGTVGMSTRGHDTGDAQWFINVSDNLRLGRDYTVFGEVTEGIDVVDGILEGDRIATMRVIR